jgi:hypothetical protein
MWGGRTLKNIPVLVDRVNEIKGTVRVRWRGDRDSNPLIPLVRTIRNVKLVIGYALVHNRCPDLYKINPFSSLL